MLSWIVIVVCGDWGGVPPININGLVLWWNPQGPHRRLTYLGINTAVARLVPAFECNKRYWTKTISFSSRRGKTVCINSCPSSWGRRVWVNKRIFLMAFSFPPGFYGECSPGRVLFLFASGLAGNQTAPAVCLFKVKRNWKNVLYIYIHTYINRRRCSVRVYVLQLDCSHCATHAEPVFCVHRAGE